jgi:hypothetical protein
MGMLEMGDQSVVVDGHVQINHMANLMAEAKLGKTYAAWAAEQEEKKKDPKHREAMVFREVEDRLSPQPTNHAVWAEHKALSDGYATEMLQAVKDNGWPIWGAKGQSMRDAPKSWGRISVRTLLDWLKVQDWPDKVLLVRALEGAVLPGLAQVPRSSKRVKATTQQEDNVIQALLARGIDPMQMPKPPLGNKAWPLRVEIGSELGYSKAMMIKTFGRLRSLGRMSKP